MTVMSQAQAAVAAGAGSAVVVRHAELQQVLDLWAAVLAAAAASDDSVCPARTLLRAFVGGELLSERSGTNLARLPASVDHLAGIR